MRSQTSGLQVNGDLSGQGVIVAYGCRSGTFQVTLLIKQPEKIDIRVNDALVRHLDFPSPPEGQSWHGDFPVNSAERRRVLALGHLDRPDRDDAVRVRSRLTHRRRLRSETCPPSSVRRSRTVSVC